MEISRKKQLNELAKEICGWCKKYNPEGERCKLSVCTESYFCADDLMKKGFGKISDYEAEIARLKYENEILARTSDNSGILELSKKMVSLNDSLIAAVDASLDIVKSLKVALMEKRERK